MKHLYIFTTCTCGIFSIHFVCFLWRSFLREVAERRQKHKQSFGDINEYGLSVVTLNGVQKRDLWQYIDQMKKDPSITIHITGHTCDIGSNTINMKSFGTF